ncbi:MAG: hypothetical protein JWM27_3788 [Gemmatimonadetes bacterium]|nr:hypothetical protein [Gemmatimonadota bacterium]
MFGGADDEPPSGASAGWERLERAAASAVSALGEWRRRAAQAEAEVVALRGVLEQVIAAAERQPGDEEELRRLRAENAVLKSRAAEARARVASLLAKLQVLEGAE